MANEWTMSTINDALAELYERQRNGQVDAKSADAMNTTLKNVVILNVKIPMDALKLFVQAQTKKIVIPPGLRKALPVSLE